MNGNWTVLAKPNSTEPGDEYIVFMEVIQKRSFEKFFVVSQFVRLDIKEGEKL